MIRHYITVAIRNIFRNKWHSFINIFSLSIGLTIATLAFLFINSEYSFDHYHKNANKIYRITSVETLGDYERYRRGTTFGTADVIIDEIPAMETVTRFVQQEDYLGLPLIQYEENKFLESKFFWSDASLFQMFDFDFIEGSRETALKDINSLVISKETATRYFGNSPALGKQVTLSADLNSDIDGRQSETYTMQISAVVDIPINSSIQFDLIADIKKSLWNKGGHLKWRGTFFTTYIKLIPTADQKDVELALPNLIDKFFDEDFKDKVQLYLQPLTEVHLGALPGNPDSNPRLRVINTITLIALSVLLLACINFINLNTTMFSKRAVEIGLRKSVGAFRSQLIIQFLFESILLSILSMILATGLAWISLPAFNEIVGTSLSLDFSTPILPISLFLIALIVGVASGLYPAFFLSSFSPKNVIKGQLSSGKKGGYIRKTLVVFQFATTIAFMFVLVVILLQTSYIRSVDLDIERDQYAIVRLKESVYNEFDKYKAFKRQLLSDPSIRNVAGTWSAPFGANVPVFNYPFIIDGDQNQRIRMHLIRADEDFIDAFDMTLIEGRKLSREFAADQTSAFVMNKKAVEMLGFENPLGKSLEVMGNSGSSFKTGKIVGVVEDFNFLSLHNEIEPLVMSMTNNNFYRYMVIRFDPASRERMNKHLEAVWDTLVPGWPLELFYMDDEWSKLYESEARLSKIIQYLSITATLIAALGLLALANFSVEKRKKEMSIRKVLGASFSGIYALISTEFIKLILLSLLIGIPLGRFLGYNWLKDFAYQTEIHWTMGLFIGIGAILFTLLTVGYHSYLSAMANPVDHLKDE